jgi:hypothetical protein
LPCVCRKYFPVFAAVNNYDMYVAFMWWFNFDQNFTIATAFINIYQYQMLFNCVQLFSSCFSRTDNRRVNNNKLLSDFLCEILVTKFQNYARSNHTVNLHESILKALFGYISGITTETEHTEMNLWRSCLWWLGEILCKTKEWTNGCEHRRHCAQDME